jgi:hypothetical protein
MKKYLFLCLIALFTTSAMAQDAMLTKEETVNYLHKKLREVEGRFTTIFSSKFYYNAPSINLMKDGTVEVIYTRSSSDFCLGGYSVKFSYRFDPSEIVRVGTVSANPGDSVSDLALIFSSRTARAREDHTKGTSCTRSLGHWEGTNGQWGDLGRVNFPYFATSPENSGRITRAILHLRDLAKAEEDPFSK